MSQLAEAQKKLGEMFIIGFEGKTLSDDTAAFISQARVGGVILFAQNYETPKQVGELVNQVQECRSEFPLWVAVDQEGGRVQRFKDPFTAIPTAEKIGQAKSPKTIFDVADVIAKELRAVGVNLNFCPVVDINSNPNNPIIGDRAYGKDETGVTKAISAMVRGHLVNQVQPCVKHFPGHGDTDKDSHTDLPEVSTTLDELKSREFRPFVRAFKSRCNMCMTAHILNKNIDEKYPATLSKTTLQDVLRKDLRFSRVIISDDMEMQAITDHYGAEEACRLAIEAGCDLLIYRSEAAARHAYSSLSKLLDSGELPPTRILESAERVQALKKDALAEYQPVNIGAIAEVVGNPEHRKIMESL